MGWQTGLAIGLAIAMSCTSIVLQTLREKGLDTTAMGRRTFAVLLFQDMSVIAMLALFAFLAIAATHAADAGHGAGGDAASMLSDYPPWMQALGVFSAVAAVILAGRFGLRPIFRAVAKTGLLEIFTALALLTVIGAALLMQIVGLSPALGAFVAGVVLADSEFRREIEADIDPFRGLLLGLFFLAVGASIDFALLSREPAMMLGLTLGLIVLKAAIMFAILSGAKKKRPGWGDHRARAGAGRGVYLRACRVWRAERRVRQSHSRCAGAMRVAVHGGDAASVHPGPSHCRADARARAGPRSWPH